jgi:hypothetical protein
VPSLQIGPAKERLRAMSASPAAIGLRVWLLRAVLLLLALLLSSAAALYWWSVQSRLTAQPTVAAALTVLLVVGPPLLVSFTLPWTTVGRQLHRLTPAWPALTVVVAALAALVYYSAAVQASFWMTQPDVLRSGLVLQQTVVGIVGFLLIPALLWMPVSALDVDEQVRQARLVRRYELQTQAQLAQLRAALLRAQEKALIGFVNLTAAERDELSDALRGLVAGIDLTLQEYADSVSAVSDQLLPFAALDDNRMVRDYLDYVADSLRRNALVPPGEPRRRPPADLRDPAGGR